MPGPIFQFGDFELQCAQFRVLRKGLPVRLERQPTELLILLASRQGELVTRGEIAAKLWSKEVFVDTDHGINTAIRKLRHLLRDDPKAPRYIQTVTGMGYRFIAPIKYGEPKGMAETATQIVPPPILTAPQAMPDFPSPQTEAEPRPERLTPAFDTSRSHARLWIGIGIAVVLLLAVAAARFSRKPLISHLLNRDAQPVITSIAVLPLDNLSGDPNQQYFADGMTDELITMLAKESTLRIVSRTSVMQYRGASGPLPEIARALNVDGILEGSVARTNDHVHLTLQLIRAETDVHLWANSYDRALNDSVALPNDAAHEIAKRLNSSLPSGSSTRYVDPAAHDAYLHGLYIFYTGSNERAGEYFKKAVEIQPDYALGLTGLAAYYGAGSFEGELDPRDALPKAEDAAAKAIALDDSLPEAHLAMAAAVYAGRWDWKWSEREIRRAIELNPHFAEAWHFYAKMLGPLNRSDEAIAAQKKGTELDPFARPWALAAILYVARQFDSCLVEAKLRSETYPHDPSLHSAKSDCFRAKGMTRQSVEELIAMYKDSGDLRSASAVSRAFNHGGIDAVVRWQIASAQKLTTKQYVSPVYLAQLHAQLGEREPTLSLLEEGFRQHSPLLLWIQRYPEFDFLHSDPQYCSLVQRAALPPLP